MTIARVKNETVIKIGQWVLPRSKLQLCGLPRLVTRDTSGPRIYFRRPKAEQPEKEQYMTRGEAVFVCDTEAEADAIAALSTERSKALTEAQQKVIDEFSVRLDRMLSLDSGTT
jgi:hypothetical protein